MALRSGLKLLAVSGVSVLFCSAAMAVDIPDAGRMLRESAPPPTVAPPPGKPEIRGPKEAPAAPAAESVRVKVYGFVFSGNTALASDELNRLMAPAVGKELTLAELEEAVGVITRAYRSKGYFLATATIPPQTLKPNQLIRVEILEGRLEEIDLKTSPPETRVPRTLLDRYRNRIATGRPAEEVSLTETVLLLNELPAIRSRLVLEPGKETGGTRATLEVTEGRPYSATIFTDNHGNNSTGYYRVGAGLDLYSPFRLGDRLSLRGQTSLSGDTQSAGANWSVPLSPSGTTLSLDYAWVRYALGGRFAPLDVSGDAHDVTLMFVQPLARRGNLFLNAFLGGAVKFLDDRISFDQSVNRRHLTNLMAGVNCSAADLLLGGGYTTFSMSYTGGAVNIDNDPVRAGDQSIEGLHTNGGFNKISGSLSRTQTLYGDLSLFASVSGQWSDKNLDSAEQISIGGPYAVRAYPVGEASSDQGVITTVELRYLLPKLGPLPGRVNLTGLFDHGYAVIDTDPLPGSTGNERHLYGAGFGVGWQWEEWASVRTTVSWHMGELPTSDNPHGDKPTVYFQVVMRY